MVTTYWVGYTGCYLLTAKLSTGIMQFLEKSVGIFSVHKMPFTHSVVYVHTF